MIFLNYIPRKSIVILAGIAFLCLLNSCGITNLLTLERFHPMLRRESKKILKKAEVYTHGSR